MLLDSASNLSGAGGPAWRSPWNTSGEAGALLSACEEAVATLLARAALLELLGARSHAVSDNGSNVSALLSPAALLIFLELFFPRGAPAGGAPDAAGTPRALFSAGPRGDIAPLLDAAFAGWFAAQGAQSAAPALAALAEACAGGLEEARHLAALRARAVRALPAYPPPLPSVTTWALPCMLLLEPPVPAAETPRARRAGAGAVVGSAIAPGLAIWLSLQVSRAVEGASAAAAGPQSRPSSPHGAAAGATGRGWTDPARRALFTAEGDAAAEAGPSLELPGDVARDPHAAEALRCLCEELLRCVVRAPRLPARRVLLDALHAALRGTAPPRAALQRFEPGSGSLVTCFAARGAIDVSARASAGERSASDLYRGGGGGGGGLPHSAGVVARGARGACGSPGRSGPNPPPLLPTVPPTASRTVALCPPALPCLLPLYLLEPPPARPAFPHAPRCCTTARGDRGFLFLLRVTKYRLCRAARRKTRGDDAPLSDSAPRGGEGSAACPISTG